MANEMLDILLRLACASSLAALAALLLRGPLRERFGANVAYLIWMLVPVSMAVALLPAPTIVAPPEPLPAPRAPLGPTLAAAPTATSSPIDFNTWALVTWLAGTTLCAAELSRQQRRFVRRLGKLVAVGERVWLASDTESCPALVGAWQPRIVLPRDFESRYTGSERALILAHERTHAARGDAQVNLFAAAMRCLFWFNPLLHFAASRFRFDQELACDASVITRFPEARRSYADAMLKTQLADFGLPVGCHWQSSHPLKERIFMLKKTLPSRSRRAAGVALAAALVTAGAAAGWAAQPKNAVNEQQGGNVAGDAINVRLAVSIDGKALDNSWTSGLTMLGSSHNFSGAPADLTVGVVDGKTFTFSMQKAQETWRIDATPSRQPDGTMRLDSTVTHNGTVVGKPGLVTTENQPAAIKIGKEEDGAFKGFEAQVALSRANVIVEAGKHGPTYRSINRVPYPEAQAASGATGRVLVLAHVGADGRVVSASVQNALGAPADVAAFSRVALDSVQNWTFNPARSNGEAVPGDALVPVIFSDVDALSDEVPDNALNAIHVRTANYKVGETEDKPPSENVEFRRMNPPRYPPAAIVAKQSGKIVLKVLVDATGVPQSAEVFKSDPPEAEQVFAGSAIAAAMQWMFTPGMHDGKPQGGYVMVPFTYTLKDD